MSEKSLVSQNPAPAAENKYWFLSKREVKALEYFYSRRRRDREPSHQDLAPQIQAQLLELYLTGATCSEIARLNPMWGLGQICGACVDSDWPAQRQQYLTDLFSRSRTRAAQAVEEGITFASDVMAATHKLYSDKLKKFIQTGADADLDDILPMVGNMRNYKEALDMLLKLTGNEAPKVVVQIQSGSDVTAMEPPKKSGLLELAQRKKMSAIETKAK